jgi:hypothetical protein
MSITYERKNMENLVQNGNILKALIEDLKDQLHTAQKEYILNDKQIKKIEVSFLDKDSLIKELGELIVTYNEDPNYMYEEGKEVNRIYADGTHEYCRNITRGNWHTISYKLFDNITMVHGWGHLFPLSFKREICGYQILEKYATMTASHATEVRKIMEKLDDIYKYS